MVGSDFMGKETWRYYRLLALLLANIFKKKSRWASLQKKNLLEEKKDRFRERGVFSRDDSNIQKKYSNSINTIYIFF